MMTATIVTARMAMMMAMMMMMNRQLRLAIPLSLR
jgi:hypothetical protein